MRKVTAIIDYSIYYKSSFPFHSDWPTRCRWDILISAFTSSERVLSVFDKATATSKHWIVFREYGYAVSQYPRNNYYVAQSNIESEIIPEFWSSLPVGTESRSICIDITGFIRPHLLFLVRWLAQMGILRFDAIYSEPIITLASKMIKNHVPAAYWTHGWRK